PTTFDHAGPLVRIGRDADCELSLQGEAHTAVSRQHARIELRAEGATLADTGSSNGTLLNGRLLESPAPLRAGDCIQMGYTGATLTVLELDLQPLAAAGARRTVRAVRIGSVAAVALAAVVVIAVILLRKPVQPDLHAPGDATGPTPTPPLQGKGGSERSEGQSGGSKEQMSRRPVDPSPGDRVD